MLIFARVGVMESNQDKIFSNHFPLILGLIFAFSSKKQTKNLGGAHTNHK
jgi:hypothetical protein